MRIGQDLDLDVAGPIDELFEVDAGVLERGLGLVAGGLQGGREVGLVAADAHSLAAAAGGGLDQARGSRSHRARRNACASVAITPSEPGTHATWADAAICLASVLMPILRMAS